MIKDLTKNIYYMPHRVDTDRPSIGLICGKKSSLVVDSGNSPNHAKEFLKEIKQLNVPPLKYLVLTHYHWDHTFGIKDMDLITIAHERTRQELAGMKKLNWDDISLEEHVKDNIISQNCSRCIKEEIKDREKIQLGDVDIAFKNSMEIDLGDLRCNIFAVGGTHTDDSTVVYIPKDKVMFLGDCIYGRRFNGLYGYDKQILFAMMDKIDEYDVDYYIISHETIWMRKDIYDFRKLLEDTGNIAGDGTSIKEAIKRFKEKFGRDPSEDEVFYIECFINVNKIQ